MTKKKICSHPKSDTHPVSNNSRCGFSVEDLKQSFLDNLFCAMGRFPMAATRNDNYTALALTVRDRVFKQGVQTLKANAAHDARVVAYLSAEFLPGPHLANNLLILRWLNCFLICWCY
jgi:starch phosphorylase